MSWSISKMRMEKFGIHASETAWVGRDLDYTVLNDTSIDELFAQIKNLVEDPASIERLPCEESSDSLHTRS